MTEAEILNRSAVMAAKRLTRWRFESPEDTQQWAWVSAERARRTYDPDRSDSLGAWAYQCVYFDGLMRLRRQRLETRTFVPVAPPEERVSRLTPDEPDPVWRREIRERVLEILRGDDGPILTFILGETTARELSALEGCTVQRIYERSRSLRSRLRKDPILRQLAQAI